MKLALPNLVQKACGVPRIARGWICSGCKAVTLERYKTRPAICPACGGGSWAGQVEVITATESAFDHSHVGTVQS